MGRKIISRLGALAPAILAGCITVPLPEPEPAPAPRAATPAIEIPEAQSTTPPPPERRAPAPPPEAETESAPATEAMPHAEPDFAARAAEIAISMLGRPYKRGGNTPRGFDCSGLVQFSYGKLGLAVPRDTRGLLGASFAIEPSELRVGDLLFFHVEGKRNSHVAIYLGGQRFVHAPSSGGAVRAESLTLPYWARHFASARRLPAPP
ncbi:MAG: NlpC/P60 family protein [Betaproteobacteria bacterium]|nr:NlpC/P60 family protein [Betaproteobacteria bacterium]